MVTLEETLIKNYHKITQPEGLHLVVDFIKKNPTIGDREFDFIKQITKVAWSIANLGDSLQGLEERLYFYCQEGINLGKKYSEGESIVNGLNNAIAHLHAYGAAFSKLLFF